MINNLIRISKEKEYFERKFLESRFIKRIYKILFNLDLMNLKLMQFTINKKEIKLSFQYYIGCNEYEFIYLSLPINLYYAKYNVLLNYIVDNINNNDLVSGLDRSEEFINILSNSFISFSKQKKLKIKELNRLLNYSFENNSNIIIKSLTKQEIKILTKELSNLQQLKEF